jgi:hypothetical protein
MDFHKYEDTLLKSQNDQLVQRDWFLLIWLTALMPIDYLLVQNKYAGNRVFFFISLMFQFLTVALLLISKSVYSHYLGLLIHADPGVDIKRWIRIHMGLSMAIVVGFALNHFSFIAYIWSTMPR